MYHGLAKFQGEPGCSDTQVKQINSDIKNKCNMYLFYLQLFRLQLVLYMPLIQSIEPIGASGFILNLFLDFDKTS